MKTKKITVLAILSFLSAARILLAIVFSQKGAYYANLESELASITEQNQELVSKMAGLTSLSKMADASSELGLSKPQEILYLVSDKEVAKLP